MASNGPWNPIAVFSSVYHLVGPGRVRDAFEARDLDRHAQKRPLSVQQPRSCIPVQERLLLHK